MPELRQKEEYVMNRIMWIGIGILIAIVIMKKKSVPERLLPSDDPTMREYTEAEYREYWMSKGYPPEGPFPLLAMYKKWET